ncbi:MAG: folate-binding protein YgfZ [Betaproteobacteria bacterium]|nr:folate-binding protein YgfZ [Betaproteobacteria bacterium]
MSERWISELTDQGARFADGRIAGFGDSPAELAAVDTQPVICDLSHDGLILVSGEDAAAFLHAQLCNDVQALSEGQAHWNGWCSPKGRLLATFLLWRGRQGYFLQLPRTLQAAIQKRLQMFVLRSKVTLADVSGDWVRFGIGGHDADALLTEVLGEVPAMPMATVHTQDGRLIRMSPQRFEFVAAADDALKLWRQLTPRAKPVGAPVWDALAIRDGVLTVVPATQDAFVPQMANFELIGGLSFKKGCYPGQEIVARTQYRGILKRRLARVHIDAPTVNVGDSLFSAEFGDQAAGTVAAAAPSSKCGFDALVVAQIEGLKTNSLRLGALDGPAAAIQPLPYAVPEIS